MIIKYSNYLRRIFSVNKIKRVIKISVDNPINFLNLKLFSTREVYENNRSQENYSDYDLNDLEDEDLPQISSDRDKIEQNEDEK